MFTFNMEVFLIYMVIKKNSKGLKLAPYLLNYQTFRRNFSFKSYEDELTWFDDGTINAAFNAVDRHALSWRRNKIAIYWEGDEGNSKSFTYHDLYVLSNKFANILRNHNINRGDRVFLFLPRIPELYFAFLGILKTGAIAGTMFSAFQEAALKDRLENSGAKIVITTKELKPRLDKVRRSLPALKEIIVVDDNAFTKAMGQAEDVTRVAKMKPNDFAFMLYTSGTTGKPKGIVHAHKAILHEYLTCKYVLDLHDEDTYWCTADPGWVTGIAYEILGPMVAGATQLVFAGRFDTALWYSLLEKYQISVWYTAPTAIRMMMAAGDALVKKYNLSNLRHLCSVGEPLNPEAVVWSNKVFGLPFHDTWWQTETGGMMICNYATMDIKPGSMGKPFPGITAAILDDKGKPLGTGKEGNLAIKKGWPSMMQTVWHNEEKYKSYFEKGWYISGDRAYRDKDGYFWFVGRADDVIKTSGERVGPFEVESALVEYPGVVEAGVIGKPDKIRGEIIKAFVVLKPGVKGTDKLKEALAMHVKKHLAGHAYPKEVAFIDKLPKTRSGKIMRRILKAKEMGQPIGDTSTLEEY